jgi:hypothetical protein
MEVTYKQVIDGIKVPVEQVRTIFEMCDLVYKTLAPQGTFTQEQLRVYEGLQEVMTKLNA